MDLDIHQADAESFLAKDNPLRKAVRSDVEALQVVTPI
jgi:hypothetical protein